MSWQVIIGWVMVDMEGCGSLGLLAMQGCQPIGLGMGEDGGLRGPGPPSFGWLAADFGWRKGL